MIRGVQTIEDVARLLLADRLVRLHTRPGFIQTATGVSARSVTSLYRYHHGGCRHSGPRRRQITRQLRSPGHHRQAILLAALWRAWVENKPGQPQVETLTHVYEYYRRVVPATDRVDLETAWILVQALSSNPGLQLDLCNTCFTLYLKKARGRQLCPWCGTRAPAPAAAPASPPTNLEASASVDRAKLEGLADPRQYLPFQQAITLLQLGARVSIVVNLTRLSRHTIRSLARSLSGRGGVPGPLPHSALSLLQPKSRYRQAVLWSSLLYGLTDEKKWLLAPNTFLDVYRLYQRLVSSEDQLNINEAWIVARDLRSGSLSLLPCRHCQAARLASPTTIGTLDCPFCRQNDV